MNARKFNWTYLIAVALMLGAGALCGAQMAQHIDAHLGTSGSSGGFILLLALMLAALFAAMYIQIIVHEAGHLVFGLLSGYRFASFRIGSLMLMRENGRMCVKRFSLAGTGGQCLMDPPDMQDGRMPYRLYNMGGSIMNALVSAIALALYPLCGGAPLAALALLLLGEIGLLFAVVNGVPLRMGTVDNDGYNALSMVKSPSALRSLWVQLKVNSAQQQGMRLRDMPAGWFALPSDEDMRNSMSAVPGVLACNRLMDEHEFERADALMARYLAMNTGIAGMHRALMVCDRIYCELTGACRADVVDGLLTKQQRKLMKAMATLPAVLRTEYALALLRDGDAEQAQKLRDRFERMARRYPYAGEISTERGLMERIGG